MLTLSKKSISCNAALRRWLSPNEQVLCCMLWRSKKKNWLCCKESRLCTGLGYRRTDGSKSERDLDGMVISGLYFSCLTILRCCLIIQSNRILLRISNDVISEALQIFAAAFKQKRGRECMEVLFLMHFLALYFFSSHGESLFLYTNNSKGWVFSCWTSGNWNNA